MKKFYTFLVMLAIFIGLSMSAMAQDTYKITNSGMNYGVFKNSGPFGQTFITIQSAIDYIKDQAKPNDCIIQFGDGEVPLNTGTKNITFDGGAEGTDWNTIFLTGKLTSACSGYDKGAICLKNNVYVFCDADIEGTSTSDFPVTIWNSDATFISRSGTISSNNGIAITNTTTGMVTIDGGTVEANGINGIAIISQTTGKIFIYNGTVKSQNSNGFLPGTILLSGDTPQAFACLVVSGGTIVNSSDEGHAIYNSSVAPIIIHGGVVLAKGGSAIFNLNGGKLYIKGGVIEATTGITVCNTDGEVNISGGTIWATGTDGIAVYIEKGTVNISGGEISVYNGRAVSNYIGTVTISGGILSATEGCTVYSDNGILTISGGMILATTGSAVSNQLQTTIISGGIIFAYGSDVKDVVDRDFQLDGNAILVAWDKAAGNLTYIEGESEDIYLFYQGEGATGLWAYLDSKNGILVKNGENEGFIPIEGIEIENNIKTMTNGALQVYPNPTRGELTINNGQLTIKSVEIFDVYGRNVTPHTSYLTPLTSYNLTVFPSGVYFLKITTENGIVTKKVVKK